MTSKVSPPWQYSWKRPEVYPVVVDETFQFGHLSNREKEQLTHHMTAIECISAHLTIMEAQTLVEILSQKPNNGGALKDTKQLLEKYDFTIVITLLSSHQFLRQERNKNNLADVLLFEIITCTEDDTPTTPIFSASKSDVSKTSIRLIYSKLMYWPSSIITNDSIYDQRRDIYEEVDFGKSTNGEYDDVSCTQKSDTLPSDSSVNKSQPFWVSMGKQFLSFLNSKNNHQSSNRNLSRRSRFKGVISASLCRRKLICNDEISTEDAIGNALQALHLMNLGLPTRLDESIREEIDKSTTVVRQGLLHESKPNILPHATNQELQYVEDEENNNVDPCTIGQQHEGEDSTQDELLLACLSNNGKLYFFSILELFQANTFNNSNDNNTNKNSNDSMSNAFESLILGSHVFTQLQSNIMPLTRPKATVVLSLSLKNLGRYTDSNKHNFIRDNTMKGVHSATVDYDGVISSENIDTNISPRPFIDLASFDANIDPKTIQYRTYNNQGTICKMVFDYIIVGGIGHRSTFRSLEKTLHRATKVEDILRTNDFIGDNSFVAKLESKTEELPSLLIYQEHLTDTSIPSHQKDSAFVIPREVVEEFSETNAALCKSNHTGGFISIVSLQFFSEVRNFFLPFIPHTLNPMIIQSTRFILISGFNLHECMAIHLDALSELHACDLYSDTSLGLKNIPIKKYEMFDVSFNALKDTSFSVNLLPIGVVTDSQSETSIVCTDQYQIYLCTFEGIIASKCSSSYSKPNMHRTFRFQVKSNVLAYETFPPYLSTKSIDSFEDRFIGGQGWSACTKASSISFICWEGSSTDLGAFHENLPVTRNSFCVISPMIHSYAKRPWTTNRYDGQYIKSYLSKSFGIESSLVLTLRKRCFDNNSDKSLNDILEWLEFEKNFLCQAKISLKLLNEEGIIQEFKDMDDDNLLDGIISYTVHSEDRARLSDLTIRALVHVGKTMSNVLERFIETNKFYLPWMAGLMLMEVINGGIETSLWAFSCILKVGMARKCMIEILNVINNALPDEIRCRCINKNEIVTLEGEHTKMELMGIYYTLISMILESAKTSAGILLHLVDSDGVSYWASLNHDTRLRLSLIRVQDRYPLLLEQEVREWALLCFRVDVDTISRVTVTGKKINDPRPMIPSSWLLDFISSYFGFSQFKTTPEEKADRPISTQNLKLYFEEKLQTESYYFKIICSSIDDGCFDFDIIILSLLLLVERNDYQKKTIGVNLQLLLNLVCDQVGMSIRSLPFISDTSMLISSCGKLKNISAAAHILGGQDGLLLSCVSILNKSTGVDINEAERFLRHGDPCNVPRTINHAPNEELVKFWKDRSEIMFLLEKFVLKSRKSPDLCSLKSTWSLDPVLSARYCFLSLYMLSRVFDGDTILSEWLENRLLSNECGKTSRIASIAVIRAILWNQSFPFDEQVQEHDFLIACGLGIGKKFLIDLCRSVVV